MLKKTAKCIVVSCLFFSHSMFCMICDSQFFPFYPKPRTRITDKPSWFSVDPFFTRADSAYDDKENEILIPCLLGQYDQRKLGLALEKVGLDNPMPDAFMGFEAIWSIDQKIETGGVALSFEHMTFRPVAFGFTWLFMHANSRHFFCLTDPARLKLAGHIEELKDARLQMHKDLGLCEAYSSRSGMGDFDAYIRVGDIWDYPLRFRRVDAGFTVGMIFPGGKKREINSVTTVPFGGDGHWGAYFKGDLELELKEDIKAGFLMRFGKRFQKTKNMRLPVAGEHPLFGALVAPVCVDPGINFLFSGYASIENLRAGLGLRLGVNLCLQESSSFQDLRSDKEKDALPAKLNAYEDVSRWTSEHICLDVFYDFGKTAIDRGYKPIVTFSWDIPYMLFLSENVVRTHRISLGIEFNF